MKKLIFVFAALLLLAACSQSDTLREDVRWTKVVGISSRMSYDFIDSTTKKVDVVSVRDGVHIETEPNSFSLGEDVLLVKTEHGFSIRKGDFEAYLSQVEVDEYGGIFCVVESDTVSLPGDLPVGRNITITIQPDGTYFYELHSDQ